MRYVQLKEKLNGFTIFSLADIRKIDRKFYRRRLSEWQAKGYIRKVIRGYYVFSDLKIDEQALFEIANRVYAPSYISFEMALSYYELIPESVYGITSASTRRTRIFKTDFGSFSYKTLTPRLYFGYEIIRHNGRAVRIASPEKAVLDYLYINTRIKSEDDFAGLRFNKDRLSGLFNRRKMGRLLKRFGHKSLAKRARLLWRFAENA